MLKSLPNGREILDQEQRPDGTYVVLAFVPAPSPDFLPIVCWRADRDGNAYCGHYHSEALASFEDRAGRPASVGAIGSEVKTGA